MSSIQAVPAQPAGAPEEMHVVEVIDCPSGSWRRTRCLTHGIDAFTQAGWRDFTTARSAALECVRFRQPPFRMPSREIAPLLPPELASPGAVHHSLVERAHAAYSMLQQAAERQLEAATQRAMKAYRKALRESMAGKRPR